MKKLTMVVALSIGALGVFAVPARPADQTVLGKSFSVKAKPGDASKTAVDGSASEKRSDDTLVGDPTSSGSAGGAILTVFANGGTPTTQSFVLDQGMSSKGKPFWSGSAGKGFSYKDPKGEQGPVTSVSIKKSPSGSFTITASITGKNGTVTIVPPDPGTDACFALQLGVDGISGDRYDVLFGPGSKIMNKDATLFKAMKPTAEGVCPFGPSTTTTTAPTTTSSTSTTAAPTTTTTSTTAAPTTTTSTTAAPTTTTTSTTAAPTTTTSSTSTTTAAPTTTTSTTTTTTVASPSGAFLDDSALSAG